MLKSVKLKGKDISFLKEHCDIDMSFNYNFSFENKSASWLFLLNSKELEIITDQLSNTFMDKGITNGEVNSFGLSIENYIDIFNYYE